MGVLAVSGGAPACSSCEAVTTLAARIVYVISTLVESAIPLAGGMEIVNHLHRLETEFREELAAGICLMIKLLQKDLLAIIPVGFILVPILTNAVV